MFCNECKRMWEEIRSKEYLSEPLEPSFSYFCSNVHHNTWESLTRSADGKCSLCVRLFRILRLRDPEKWQDLLNEWRSKVLSFRFRISARRSHEAETGSPATLIFEATDTTSVTILAVFNMISPKCKKLSLHRRYEETSTHVFQY